MDTLLLIGYILYGGFFVMAGAMHFMNMKGMTEYTRMKKVPLPGAAVALSGIVIMLAGLGLIFGIYQALSLIVLAVFLAVITPVMHTFWSVEDASMKMVEMQMFLKNMALLGAALALLAPIV